MVLVSSEQDPCDHRVILGVCFFQGTALEAVQSVAQGGLVVVPAAPALKELETNASYREALLNADLAIADSAFMVMLWNLMTGDSITRLSGLRYLRELLEQPDLRKPANSLWIMPNQASAECNLAWLKEQGIEVPAGNVYLAPLYGDRVEDEALVALIERLRPQHVIVTLGGGVQEPLGLYLKRHLSYRASIHCIGAAIAFLSGDQVEIPEWADHLYLG
jgi:N-acetylglucosaminyldiphosphoundecaprenol N-acetyl-beta-D-mannosaminyltransferase